MMNLTRKQIRAPYWLSEWFAVLWYPVLLALVLVVASAVCGVIAGRLWATW